MSKAKYQPSADLARLCQFLESGLRVGRSLADLLQVAEAREMRPSVRQKIGSWRKYLMTMSRGEALRSAHALCKNPEERLFLQVIVQVQKSSHHAAKLLGALHKILLSQVRMHQKMRSLRVIPLMQILTIVVSSFSFAILLPRLFPHYFVSFDQLGRWDLFSAGISLVVLGALLSHRLFQRPQKSRVPHYQFTIFVQFLSFQISSGRDLMTAWNEALNQSPLSEALKHRLTPQGSNARGVNSFLQQVSHGLPLYWVDLIDNLSWVLKNGQPVVESLQAFVEYEFESNLFEWELELKRASILVLLPMSLLCAPGCLFLILGPQFYRWGSF